MIDLVVDLIFEGKTTKDALESLLIYLLDSQSFSNSLIQENKKNNLKFF
jgi:hypothetical protein